MKDLRATFALDREENNNPTYLFYTHTHQIDWIYFPGASCQGLLNDVRIIEDKLYILDTGDQLHLLEKE